MSDDETPRRRPARRSGPGTDGTKIHGEEPRQQAGRPVRGMSEDGPARHVAGSATRERGCGAVTRAIGRCGRADRGAGAAVEPPMSPQAVITGAGEPSQGPAGPTDRAAREAARAPRSHRSSAGCGSSSARGSDRIDARLDLHGLTQAQAHDADRASCTSATRPGRAYRAGHHRQRASARRRIRGEPRRAAPAGAAVAEITGVARRRHRLFLRSCRPWRRGRALRAAAPIPKRFDRRPAVTTTERSGPQQLTGPSEDEPRQIGVLARGRRRGLRT